LTFLAIKCSLVSCYFLLLGKDIFPSCTLFANTVTVRTHRNVTDQVSHPHKTEGKIIVLYTVVLTFSDSKREDKRFWTEWQQAFPESRPLF